MKGAYGSRDIGGEGGGDTRDGEVWYRKGAMTPAVGSIT